MMTLSNGEVLVTTAGGHLLPDSVHQEVRAESGHAYGVIGGDLHVVAGRPVYLLRNYVLARPAMVGSRPPAQPSYLLNARSAVVGFTGRQAEVRDLLDWRDGPHGLAARWMLAPGGQGKTRLADHLAEDAVRAGWKVIVADQMTATVDAEHPVSQDLRIGTAAGLLMVVDYADRWPLAHLTWLFSNKVLNQNVPVRVLMLARTVNLWPALRHALVQAGWSADACTTRRLGPLQDSRAEMFTAARDSFARHYRLPNAHLIPVPDGLERDEFGLTLAVHMAALVAVDRHASAAVQPPLPGMTGLTEYLLGRERLHWEAVRDTSTGPDQMTRAVFTAVLTGPVGYRDGKAALEVVGIGSADVDRVLDDHTVCYPPTDQSTVLEPLYPDRLAEDFLALCLPGHDVHDFKAGAWAADAPKRLLTPTDDDQTLPPYAARAFVFLTAAAERWPHVLDTLEALEPLLPEDPTEAQRELATAAAGLLERLADHRSATLTEPAQRADAYANLGYWLDRAGREQEAVEALREATRLYRELSAGSFTTFGPKLAEASQQLAQSLVSVGMLPDRDAMDQALRAELVPHRSARPDEAMAAFSEAVDILRRLAEDNPGEYERQLAVALTLAAFLGPHLGPPAQLAAFAREAHELGRRLADTYPDEWGEAFPLTLMTLAVSLVELDPGQAEELSGEAVSLARQGAKDNLGPLPELLSMILSTRCAVLLRLGETEAALVVLRDAVAAHMRYESQNDSVGDAWSAVLSLTLGEVWVHASADSAPANLTASLDLLRMLARNAPKGFEPALVSIFMALVSLLQRHGLWEEILTVYREVTVLLRSTDDIDAGVDIGGVAGALGVTGSMLAGLGRWEEAVAAISESAEELQRETPEHTLDSSLTGVVQDFALRMSNVERDPAITDPYRQVAREEAVPVLERIAATYRSLAGEDAAKYEPGLAATLKLQSEALWMLGAHADAVAAGTEAVELRRRLAVDGSAEHLDGLALALYRLAEKLGATGRYEESAALAGQAADVRRQLVRTGHGEHESRLATALHLAAASLRRFRPEDAVAPAREAVEILGRLAREDPAEHEDSLAAALANLAVILRSLGRTGESLSVRGKEIELRRRCLDAGPAQLPDMAHALREWAIGQAERRAGLANAWMAIAEAVDMYRWLAARNTPDFSARLDDAMAIMEHVLADLTGPGEVPVMGTVARYVAGDIEWTVLLDPYWTGRDEQGLPTSAMIGGWPLDEGKPGPFQPNPGYVPPSADAPTDPVDFWLHVAAKGGQVAEQLLHAIRDAVLEIACDENGQPLVGTAPDGVRSVLVVTARRHRQRLLLEHWLPASGARLPEAVPDGVDVMINSGGPAQTRLFRDSLTRD